MKTSLPLTGTNRLLELVDPHVPDDFINDHWNARPTRGPKWRLSAAQLWRVHLLALLTPVHSLNLLAHLLTEQRQWRAFARLRNRHEVPDVRLLHAFRCRLGVMGLRQINRKLLEPLIQKAALWERAVAIMDSTDLPAACSGFKKKRPELTPPTAPPRALGPSRAARAVGLWGIKSTPCASGGASIRREFCWCR